MANSNPKNQFQAGNKVARSRKIAIKQRMHNAMLEGLRLAEQNIQTESRRNKLTKEGKEADEINAILAETEDLNADEALVHFWRRLGEFGTDSSMKIIAERLFPKAKLPATLIGKNISREEAVDRVSKMMVHGEIPPDVAQTMISALNGVAELEERTLMIKMATLQVQAIEKGLLDINEDD